MEKTHKLFVYGLLKKDSVIDDAIYCREIYLCNESYPAVVFVGEGDRLIYGQVITVDQKTLEKYDDFEEVPKLYQRVQTETLLGEKVWVYEYNIEFMGLDNLTVYPRNIF